MSHPFKYKAYNIVDGNKVLGYFVNCKNRASAENIMKDEMFYHGNSEEEISGAVSVGLFEDNTVCFLIEEVKNV